MFDGLGREVSRSQVKRALKITGSVSAEDCILAYIYGAEEQDDIITLDDGWERTYSAAEIDEAVAAFIQATEPMRVTA